MKDLFGNEIDEFVSAKERYGIWPITVWDCDMQNPDTKFLKSAIGDSDKESARAGALWKSQGGGPNFCYSGRHEQIDGTFGFRSGASVFNPAIASWILNMYAPTEGVCFDPFAGGGTRAIMAAKHGLNYVGCEIRLDEVNAVVGRCERVGVSDKVCLINSDSREANIDSSSADFSFTCPPYFNLEQYDGGKDDLSMAPTYLHFCSGISGILDESLRILKPGSIAVWVVGLLRDESGELIALNHDIGKIAKSRGFVLKEEIILAQRNNGAVQRVGNFERGNKFLIRTHEYALVFQKHRK